MGYDWETLEKRLKKELTDERYRHTLGVMYTACSLAMRHDVNPDQARAAGLLHDCAKCLTNKKKLSMCQKKKVKLTEFEKSHPFLIHAKLGAVIARDYYGVEDTAVLDAIRWHTTGKPAMTDLEKIIYIADYIEPNRFKAPRLEKIRRAAFQDLDVCMYMITCDSVNYLKADPGSMDRMTLDAYHYYKELTEKRNTNDGVK
ncbi:MAG: bis(5'-nucleosyl)-tetraphosphatase (symmetrical) YqeK [Lachnospiraceae bacterium]|nr:bis(5'-nucleosyl)-tetraphosphatase (symmetrical) YqeK [Lachnospiraceae bacterium]